MVVALAVFDFHLPFCRSLKEKRAFLRPLKTRLRGEFEISAAEIGHQDLLQRALVGVAAIGPDREGLEPLLSRVFDFVETHAEEHGAELAGAEHDFLAYGDAGAPGFRLGGSPEEGEPR